MCIVDTGHHHRGNPVNIPRKSVIWSGLLDKALSITNKNSIWEKAPSQCDVINAKSPTLPHNPKKPELK